MTLYKRALFKRFKTKYAPDEVDKLALLIILAFLTIFGIMGCIEAYADSEEVVNYNVSNDIVALPSQNYFSSRSGASVGYVSAEVGYIYTITNNTNFDFYLFNSDNAPTVNGVYEVIGSIPARGSYSLRVVDDTYIYIATSAANYGFDYDYNLPMTRLKIGSMDGSVNDLVENVGVNQIWNIFDISVEYIVIAVAVAFGIFLIVLAIRKVTKGKSEF